MAEFTIDTAIAAIEAFGPKVANEGVSIMQGEVPKRTGALAGSIHAEQLSSSSWFVGSDIEYAAAVENGRKEVKPRYVKALHWFDGGDVFAMKAKATKPNKFVERTASKLQNMTFSL